MRFKNIKHGTYYHKVKEAINCNNNQNNDLSVIYIKEQGRFIKLRLFLIKLLLPKEVFVRNHTEFHLKFTKEE